MKVLEGQEEHSHSERPWISINHDDIDASYTSLTGINVIGLEAESATIFSAPYSYLYAACDMMMRGVNGTEAYAYFKQLDNSRPFKMMPSGWPQNITYGDEYNALFNVSSGSGNYYQSSFFLTSNMEYRDQYLNGSMFFGTRDLARTVSVYKCALKSAAVEANLRCMGAGCNVHKMRRLPDNYPSVGNHSDNGTPWAVANTLSSAHHFFQNFPSMGGIIGQFSSHPVDNYIYGKTSQNYFESGPIVWRNWSSISDDTVSQRLTEILNTYWNAGRWPTATTRIDPYGERSLNQTSGEPYVDLWMNRTDATVTRSHIIYEASVPWILVLLFSSIILLVLGIANIFVSAHTTVPDIFGYVSSLALHNPHIKASGGGSALSGTEQTRILKDIRVQLGDVQRGEAVGHIALKSVEGNDDVARRRPHKARLYT